MMATRKSAGILLYRIIHKKTEVLLVHPGGPFWAKKDDGAWTIPKGEFNDDEDAFEAAHREFLEETGKPLKGGKTFELQPIRQKSGKIVYAWAIEGDMDAATMQSNDFEMEWPPRSGKMQSFPEVDRASWFDTDTARQKINPQQALLIDELEILLNRKP